MDSKTLCSKLDKAVEFLQSELSQIRTGRASPALIEEIQVDVYGTKLTLREVGSISAVDAHNLVVSPWDKSTLTSIASSIRKSELNLNPSIDGDLVRVPIPPLTEERRKEFAKVVSVKLEDTRNTIRSIRQEHMKDIDKQHSEKLISEDVKFKYRDEVEKTVKEYTDKVGEIAELKTQELLKV